MKYNFKQIFALGTSALLIGMTAGMVGAANYPAPFVVGGSANVGIVYGTGSGVSSLDLVQAGNIQSSLQSYMTGTTGTTTTTSGETVSLDTSSTRIWLNTSLNTAKSTLTKTDLPTVLADYTFSGNTEAKLTANIKFVAGDAAGGANSGKVIFAKQPKSSNDPVIGISLGTSQTDDILYNASVTMSAINFTHTDSEGEEIELFGQAFTISSDTDTTDLVLLKEAETVSLNVGGSSPNPSTTVTIGGETYTVELITASGTAATIKVTDSSGETDSKEISEADSKKVQGLEVAVKTASSSSLESVGESVTIIVGAEKLTFTNGAAVTTGDTADPIDGTYAYIVGGTGATTELAVAVFRPDSSNDAILAGESLVDPVFGSFKVDFAGLSSALDDTGRETITVENSGDDSMSLTMTDSDGNTKTFEIAHNATYASAQANTPVYKPANWRLADDSNYSIFVHEGANITEDGYLVLGNEDYGHLLRVIQIYNNTGDDHTNDQVKVEDVISGETYSTTFTSEGLGSLSLDGKTYVVHFTGSGDNGATTFKYPVADSTTVNTWVVYPTIKTQNGALVALYEPLNANLSTWNGTLAASATILNFPDGDDYTPITLTYVGADTQENWTVSGGGTTARIAINATAGTNYTTVAVGEFTYNITSSGSTNRTLIYLTDPEDDATNLAEPGVMVFEGKDDNSEYHGFVINFETAPAGTSSNGVGVDDVLFTQYSEYYWAEASRASDSDFTEAIDWYGTLVTTDASEATQKTVTVSYPKSQVYAQIYLGASGSSVIGGGTTGGATALGDVLVKDSEVSSVSSKNLIVVGGSCINSVAATLVGGAYCGSSWTDETSVGSGQFLIQSFGDAYTTGNIALLVAGYDVADTVNAATYLRTQTVDTTADKKYIGTTATQATLQVA